MCVGGWGARATLSTLWFRVDLTIRALTAAEEDDKSLDFMTCVCYWTSHSPKNRSLFIPVENTSRK